MSQAEVYHRQRSVSNVSSINTPKLNRRLSQIRKDSLFFSNIQKKQKNNSHYDHIVQNLPSHKNYLDPQQLRSNLSKSIKQNNQKNKKFKVNKNQEEENIKNNQRQKQRRPTPCKDLFQLFRDQKISDDYIQLMEKNKFKNLVVISVILPYNSMRSVSKLLQFQQNYQISIPSVLFSTQSIKLNNQNSKDEVYYVFWTYELSEDQEQNINKSSIRSSYMFDKRLTPKSIKDIRSSKGNDQFTQLTQKQVLKRLLVQIPQIVITSKTFVKQNPHFFFPSLDYESSSKNQPNRINLHMQLDVEKSLIYFDDQISTKLDSRFITPNLQKNTSIANNLKQKKSKQNQIMMSIQQIHLQADQQHIQEVQRKGILSKNQLQKLDTVRSGHNSYVNLNQEVAENQELHDLLQKQSIFKSANFLSSGLLDQQTNLMNDNNENLEYEKNNRRSLSSKREISKIQKFWLFLTQWIKMSIRRNFQYSRFCSSWIFLHFITNCYHINSLENQNQPLHFKSDSAQANSALLEQTYSVILQRSLKSFKKQIQLRFYLRLQNQYREVIDQVTLRNMLRDVKKDQIIFIKKNFGSIAFPIIAKAPTSLALRLTSTFFVGMKKFDSTKNQNQQMITKQYLSQIQLEILAFMDRLQEEIYFENNKQAMQINQQILKAEYEKIIELGFRKEKMKKKESLQSNTSIQSEQRPMFQLNQGNPRRSTFTNNLNSSISQQLQRDLNDFMDAYNKKGIKVSSQLKTFNQFIQKTKHSYLKNVNQLTKQKKSIAEEDQEIQNKNKMIRLLEVQILKLQEKKRQVKQKNELIKKKIQMVDQKQTTKPKTNKKDKQKENLKLKGNDKMYSTAGDKFADNKQKNEDNIDSVTGRQTQNRFRKTGSLSFEMSGNKNKKSTVQKKLSFSNRYDRDLNKQQNFKSQNKRNSRQIINQVDQQQIERKNKCFNGKCCQIM